MRKCTDVGYRLRAVIMPIVPIEGWQNIHTHFLETLLVNILLDRITLGQICSYSGALQLQESMIYNNCREKLGCRNPSVMTRMILGLSVTGTTQPKVAWTGTKSL